MSDKILVDRETLEELVEAALSLEAMEVAGVNNWEGCDFAEFPNDDDVKIYIEEHFE